MGGIPVPGSRERPLLCKSQMRQKGTDESLAADNAIVESFNGRLRDDCLNTHLFLSMEDARAKTNVLRRDCNECHPHTWLGWLTPIKYAAAAAKFTVK